MNGPLERRNNLDDMILSDLKKYVAQLEKKLALMRKDKAFGIENQQKMLRLVEVMREEPIYQKSATIVTNSALDSCIEQLQQRLENFNEKSTISAREMVRKKMDDKARDFVARSSFEAEHLDQERLLIKQISDKEKQLEVSQLVYHTTMLDIKESILSERQKRNERYSKKLADVDQFPRQSLGYKQDFNADKMRTLVSIWDIQGISDGSKETFTTEMKFMHAYFSRISRSNLSVMQKLQSELADLLKEESFIKSQLRQTLLDNQTMLVIESDNMKRQYKPSHRKTASYSSKNVKERDEKRLEKLQYRNDMLGEHLRLGKEDLENAQNQFIAETRKVNVEVAFKAHILEELTKIKIRMERLETQKGKEVASFHKVASEQEGFDRQKPVNVFTLGVEDSDTLFVPPAYHDFWETIVKKFAERKEY